MQTAAPNLLGSRTKAALEAVITWLPHWPVEKENSVMMPMCT